MTGRCSQTESSQRQASARRSSRIHKEDESWDSLRFEAYDFIRENSQPFEKYYELGAMLGVGAFGAVHMCVHLATKTSRAVKIISKSNTSPEDNELAYQEFKIMAKMDHPNIARTYGLYEDNTAFYLVMDLYEGGDLFEVLEQRGPLSEYETASVVNSLIMSIGYCHENKLVHRDLKPENVLLEKVGNYDFAGAKLIDFGFACWEKGKDTKFNQCLGTLEYVSPQVLDSNYGRACDLWSVGVITYVLLSGHTPFYGATDIDIAAAIQEGVFTFRGPKWEHVSEDCKDFIQQLLTVEEDARPSAYEALHHRWLVRMRQRQRKEHHNGDLWQAMIEALQALERFRSRGSKLKQATCVLLATQFMTKSDRQLIDPLFRELDGQCQGSITVEDLQNAFWYTDFAGKPRTENCMNSILKEVNVSRTGSISYCEFAAVVMLETGLVDKERLQAVFDHYDADFKGKIDRHDLSKVLFPDRSGRYSEPLCRKIIAEATDHKSISFSTFKKIMRPSSRERHRSSHTDKKSRVEALVA